MTQTIKRVKDYSDRERLEKIGLTSLLEKTMRRNLIEILKIINRISYYSWHFFNIYPQIGLVWFYGISTIVVYLRPNPLYTYISNI